MFLLNSLAINRFSRSITALSAAFFCGLKLSGCWLHTAVSLLASFYICDQQLLAETKGFICVKYSLKGDQKVSFQLNVLFWVTQKSLIHYALSPCSSRCIPLTPKLLSTLAAIMWRWIFICRTPFFTPTQQIRQRKQQCARVHKFICTDAHSYYFFVASMTFPADSLYTCARSKRDSSHAHTPRQTTHKRPALPRRRQRREFSCIFFSALLFTTRRPEHTIIFIVFWVKFCVHDEGLCGSVIGGVALYNDGCVPPHTQPNSALFPSSPTHAMRVVFTYQTAASLCLKL